MQPLFADVQLLWFWLAFGSNDARKAGEDNRKAYDFVTGKQKLGVGHSLCICGRWPVCTISWFYRTTNERTLKCKADNSPSLNNTCARFKHPIDNVWRQP